MTWRSETVNYRHVGAHSLPPRREPSVPTLRHITMDFVRCTAFAGSLTLLLVGSGCSDDEAAQPSACEELWAQAEGSFGADGEVAGYTPEDDSTFVVKAQNGSDETRRLAVNLDGESEIDIEIPGLPGCSHPPVLTFGFDSPAGEVEVEARSGDLSSSESVTVADQQPTWLVVQISNDEVATTVWDERPIFG